MCLIQGMRVWVCANVKCLCLGWNKARVQRYIEWMCGFCLRLNRWNLWHWNSFFRAATIYNIFRRLHLTPRKEKPSALFFPDESYVQVEEKVMSPTFILSEVLWQSHLRYLKCSSRLQHCAAGLNVHLLDVIGVMFDSLIHRSFLKLLLCALNGILHMALYSTWFIRAKFLDILLLNRHSALFISSPGRPPIGSHTDSSDISTI